MTSPAPVIEPIKAIANILQSEMGIASGNIMLGLENWFIPKTRDLYIALFYGPDEAITSANSNGLDDSGNFVEIQEAVMLHHIDLDLMSFNAVARKDKQAVIWALSSYAAQQAMETYGMKFATTPTTFLPVPGLEETKQLNRFRMTFAVNALWRKVKQVPYYDTIDPPQITPNA